MLTSASPKARCLLNSAPRAVTVRNRRWSSRKGKLVMSTLLGFIPFLHSLPNDSAGGGFRFLERPIKFAIAPGSLPGWQGSIVSSFLQDRAVIDVILHQSGLVRFRSASRLLGKARLSFRSPSNTAEGIVILLGDQTRINGHCAYCFPNF